MTINLNDAAKYYKGLPHQDEAWEFLQSRSSIATLAKFAALYRTAPKAKTISDDVVLNKVLNRCKELGIKFTKPKTGYQAYVVGLEGCNTDFTSNSDQPDRWNDATFVLKIHASGKVTRTDLFACTTEPGKYYVRHRLNPLGGAFTQIDMIHKDVWMRGRHKDQNNCLIQIGNEITVVRDNNNSHGRSQSDPTQKGYFGINFHHTKGNYSKSSIGRWSAGCLVVPNVQQHQHMMGHINKAVNKKISYILLSRKAIG